MKTITNAKFSLGKILVTPNALECFANAQEDALAYLQRHAIGDWGDLCPEDIDENDLSLKDGYRILSAYHLKNLDKIWIITEADRSVTTILLPEDY